MRGAVDLHYHVDPGYGRYENLAQAKAAGVQRLIATHAADLTGKMTLDQMKEAAKLGAWFSFRVLDEKLAAEGVRQARVHRS
jgi:hypothetical protein